jgi:hypothetical protein
MRNPIPFDTHAFMKRLTAAGVPEAQAEVHARAIADLVSDQLATKRDLEEVRLALQHDVAELEVRLRHDLNEMELRLRADTERLVRELELRLTLRLGGVIAAGIAIVAVPVKLL